MKKFLGTMLAFILVSSVLAGCGKEESPAATDSVPAATDSAASEAYPATADTTPTTSEPAATDAAPAASDTTTAATDAAAIDLTAYPVIWCQEYPFDAGTYDRRYNTTAASEIYEEDDVIGTIFTGFRLIDDTHIENFGHIKLNDDIDSSLLLSSLDEEVFIDAEQTRINDRETDWVIQAWTYEIDGTYFIVTDENGFSSGNLGVSPDFTSFFQGKTEYTYHADYTPTNTDAAE